MTTTPHEPTDKPRRASKPKKEIIGLDAPRTIHVKPTQTEIPQFEQERIGDIERAADQYVEKRDLRMGIQREEIDAKAKLSALLHLHKDKIDNQDGVIAYNRGDYKIVISTKEDLKVKIDSETDATSLEVDNEAGEDVD